MTLSIIDAMDSPKLFGRWFQGPSWNPWRAALKSLYAIPMSDDELAIFRSIAERDPPKKPVRRAAFIVGRRGGKDSIASAISGYEAAFFDRRDRLRRGEVAHVKSYAVDREQSRIQLDYVRAFYKDIPFLKNKVSRETRDGFELTNDIAISVGTSSFRSVRGRSILNAVISEAAFLKDETSAAPDIELWRALEPGTATLDGSIIVISTPYRRAGLLWDLYKDHYGRESDTLVIKAPTRVMNPTISQEVVNAALAADGASASAEWLAEWRDDVSDYISATVLDRAMPADYHAPSPEFVARFSPVAAVDVSGGSGTDSFATAVAWFSPFTEKAELVGLLETPGPLNVEQTTKSHAAFVSQFGITRVIGDRYAGLWPAQRWEANGIRYQVADRTRSEIFRAFLPILNSEQCLMLPNARLRSQFLGLERRTSPSGRDDIQAFRGHDDLCQVAASSLLLAYERGTRRSPVVDAYTNKKSYILNPSFAKATGLTGRRFDAMARRIAPAGVRYDQ